MSQRIAHLTAGETVTEGRFQIHSARVCQAATGPYLFLRLGDETGRISAIRWNASDAEQKHALSAQAVFVSGRVRAKAGFPNELEVTAFECLPRPQDAASATPEAVYQSLIHEAQVSHQIQRVQHAARVLFGPEAGSFQRQELFEAELRRTLERAYTLGRNAPRQAPARPPFTIPVRFPVGGDEDFDNPFDDD